MRAGQGRRAVLDRITTVPDLFGGKPVIRGKRLAVEHVLAMLGSGDDVATILSGYPWLELEDIQACLLFADQIDHLQAYAYEWNQPVESTESHLDDGQVYKEWEHDAEPDYDSEEDTRSEGGHWFGRVTGHV